jgi:hypothetical protein
MDINDSNDEIDDEMETTCKWTKEHEEVLVEWGDKAMCYGRLHFKSNQYYSYLNKWFTIPVIIMSILTGVGNFAFQKYNIEIQTIAINAIGGINILSGIISTIGQSLKIAELNEAHRVSSISWDKFYRNIKVELSKHPDERVDPISMLKMYKEEFDRLMEISPLIREDIIKEFKDTFTNMKDEDKLLMYKKLKKPEICDDLISVDDFRHKWYKENNTDDTYNINLISLKKKRQLEEKEKEILFLNFKTQFMHLNNREPLEYEIIDNLKEKIDIKNLHVFIDKSNNV